LNTKTTKDTTTTKLADEPTKPLPELDSVEIQEVPESKAGELQIGEELRLVEARDGLDRLHLNHDRICDEQIKPIPGIEPKTVVLDRQADLPPDGEPSSNHFMGEAVFIRRLQQTGPKAR
jgi:hypothetical protein